MSLLRTKQKKLLGNISTIVVIAILVAVDDTKLYSEKSLMMFADVPLGLIILLRMTCFFLKMVEIRIKEIKSQQ